MDLTFLWQAADVALPTPAIIAQGGGIDPADLWSRFVELLYGASPAVAIFMLIMWLVERNERKAAQVEAKVERDKREANSERGWKALSDTESTIRELQRSVFSNVRRAEGQGNG